MNKDYITIQWHIQDVLEIAPNLTRKQAREVLTELKRNHDACYGINWDTLRDTVTIMFPDTELDND